MNFYKYLSYGVRSFPIWWRVEQSPFLFSLWNTNNLAVFPAQEKLYKRDRIQGLYTAEENNLLFLMFKIKDVRGGDHSGHNTKI